MYFLLLSNPVKCIFNNSVYHVFIDYHTMSVMQFCNLYYSHVSCITVQTCMSFSFIFSVSLYGFMIAWNLEFLRFCWFYLFDFLTQCFVGFFVMFSYIILTHFSLVFVDYFVVSFCCLLYETLGEKLRLILLWNITFQYSITHTISLTSNLFTFVFCVLFSYTFSHILNIVFIS